MNWVIDTNILVFAFTPTEEKFFMALEFMLEVKRNHLLAIDHKYSVIKQYDNNLRANDFYRKWLKYMFDEKKVLSFDAKIPQKHEDNLLKRHKFHDDDLLFVGVAYNSGDKLLVTEDRDDYTEDVINYLGQRLDIRLYFLDNLLTLRQE